VAGAKVERLEGLLQLYRVDLTRSVGVQAPEHVAYPGRQIRLLGRGDERFDIVRLNVFAQNRKLGQVQQAVAVLIVVSDDADHRLLIGVDPKSFERTPELA